eukprot:2465445-Amphidinium_carterae.1
MRDLQAKLKLEKEETEGKKNKKDEQAEEVTACAESPTIDESSVDQETFWAHTIRTGVTIDRLVLFQRQ